MHRRSSYHLAELLRGLPVGLGLGDLGANVKMYAGNFYILQLLRLFHHIFQLPEINPKFVFFQARSDVFVRVCIHIRIYPESNQGNFIFFLC